MKALRSLVAVVCVLFVFISLVQVASAAPGLRITKPPVTGPLTGPNWDAAASNGQWFLDLSTTNEEYRTHEFYDNVKGSGGGEKSFGAITGFVSNVGYNPSGNITNFEIMATIFNDTGTEIAPWAAGSNSHYEVNNNTENSYMGIMKDVKLTADFAISNWDPAFPTNWVPPYYDTPIAYIVADNEDQLAWYCWNEMEQEGGSNPGNYHVPTWDFGDIPLGQPATRVLKFTVIPEMPPADPRFNEIVDSYSNGSDILLNRTTSLKISDWIETISADPGAPYPEPPTNSSDVSVFFNLEDFDFGDAPYDGGAYRYETLLAQNGACHVIVAGVMMGTNIDAEIDGQPSLGAIDDDLNGNPPPGDEDGVKLATGLYSGVRAVVEVVVSVDGYINAWMDFASDGSWAEAEDYIIQEYAVTAGTNSLSFMVSTNAVAGADAYARFRFSTQKGVNVPYGSASDGEVEDYMWKYGDESEAVDFGDAPDSYQTLRASGGAEHTIGGPWLGGANGQPDPEIDGQPDPNAFGDDNDGNDDERGVWIAAGSELIRGKDYLYTVDVNGGGGQFKLWVDWNGDGMFDDSSEKVTDISRTNGHYNLLITAPTNAFVGQTFARARISTFGGLTPTGLANDGEVEDHAVMIADGFADWGNLQWPYTTTAIIGTPSETIYGRVYIQGITDNPGHGATINAQLGFGSDGSNADGTWTWTNAVFNQSYSTNYEYMATITIGASGTYDYAYRYSLNDTDWTYGDIDGSNNGYTNTMAGDIVVTALPQFSITNVMAVATSDTATVWWGAEARVVYQLQFVTNLSTNTPMPWSNIGTQVTGPINVQSDTNAVNTPRFYRVIAPYAK